MIAALLCVLAVIFVATWVWFVVTVREELDKLRSRVADLNGRTAYMCEVYEGLAEKLGRALAKLPKSRSKRRTAAETAEGDSK